MPGVSTATLRNRCLAAKRKLGEAQKDLRRAEDRGFLSHREVKIDERLRTAAAIVAAGGTIGAAAEALGTTRNAVKGLRKRHPDVWSRCLHAARADRKELVQRVAVSDGRVIPDAARERIDRAVALIATGKTEKEVLALLGWRPYAVNHLRNAYPRYWREARRRAKQIGRVLRSAIGPELTFEDPTSQVPLSTDMTLGQFFLMYVWPIILLPRGTRDKTYHYYCEALRLWAVYTGDPPLARIDEAMAARFGVVLAAREYRGKKLSPNTVRKHCGAVQFVLDRAGPRGRHNRKGAGLMAEPPYIERPRQRCKAADDVFTKEQVERLLAVCDRARLPLLPGIEPADFWRSLFVFLWNTGQRIGAGLQIEWTMIECNRLTIPPEIAKGAKGGTFYLNVAALAAIEDLRAKLAEPHDRIFPWPHDDSELHKVRRELLAAAGIAHKPGEKGFHAFRRALGTHLAAVNPLLGPMALGNTPRVFAGSYVAPAIVASIMNAIPQPARAVG